MKAIIVLIIPFLLFSCSNDVEVKQSYPKCLQLEVDRILESSPQSPRATIELYTYQNENVYVVNTNFADYQTNVYNSQCQLICTIGGIDGNENDTCVDWENAEFIETLWTDER
jgi:hypothetical protein